jgi:hypothetical protein
LPDLDPVGKVAGRKSVNIGNCSTGGERKLQFRRKGTKAGRNIYELMEEGIFTAGYADSGGRIGKRPYFGKTVKLDIERSDSILMGHGDAGIAGRGGVGGTGCVINALGLREALNGKNSTAVVSLRTVSRRDQKRSQKKD